MNAQEQVQMEEKLEAFLLAGGTMSELYGVTEEALEALYTKGFQEYAAQQYEKAIDTFAYLVYLQPDEKRYLFAFAAALQVIKDYKKAIYYYTIAASQDISDPTITLHIIECLVALEMHGDALEALDVLVSETVSEPQWSALHAKALAYKALLTNKTTAGKA